jgi:hypothetical protein
MRPSYLHLGFFFERVQETETELLNRCIADYEGRGLSASPGHAKAIIGRHELDEMTAVNG